MANMTPAEFKCARESLGLSTRWLADRWGVAEMSVKRWEKDRRAPAELAGDLLSLRDAASAAAEGMARSGAGVIEVPRVDADSPDGMPASYHRAVAQMAALRSGAGIAFAGQRGFDLASRPWIPVEPLEGRPRMESIAGALERAHEIRCLSAPPVESLPVLRLLMAVAMRAHLAEAASAPSLRGWRRALAGRGRFDGGAVRAYLSRWCFDLLSDERPFMQCPGLDLGSGARPASALRADSGGPFGMPAAGSMGMSDAAVALLAHHAYDVGGIKAPVAGGGPRAYAPKGSVQTGWLGDFTALWMEGGTLFDTIVANLPLCDREGVPFTERPADLPPWELGAAPTAAREASPEGPVQALTWQSRRVRLVAESGKVTGVVTSYGDCPRKGATALDPMAAAPRDGGPAAPRLGPDDPLWLSALELAAPGSAPPCVAWASRSGIAGLALRAFGVQYDKYRSCAVSDCGGSVAVSGWMLGGGPEADAARSAMRALAGCARDYASLGARLLSTQGGAWGSGSDAGRALRADLRERALFDVEPAAVRWLAGGGVEPGGWAGAFREDMARLLAESFRGLAEERVGSWLSARGGRTAGDVLVLAERTLRKHMLGEG